MSRPGLSKCGDRVLGFAESAISGTKGRSTRPPERQRKVTGTAVNGRSGRKKCMLKVPKLSVQTTSKFDAQFCVFASAVSGGFAVASGVSGGSRGNFDAQF